MELISTTIQKIAQKKPEPFDGKSVLLKGWVHNTRSSGKIKFLQLRDGTGIIQVVFVRGECSDEAFENFDKLTQESALEITGTVRAESRSKLGYEITGLGFSIVHIADAYPITPKEHGVEFLMENRHLWVRSQRQWAALRIRSELFRAVTEFFYQNDFVRYDAPMLTPTSCEGTSTLFSTNYFDEKAYLTQSGQLYGETGAMAHRNIFVFGPCFRAEKSKTREHLTEFWMVEPEMAFANLNDAMDLGERFVKFNIQWILDRCKNELNILERNIPQLEGYVSTPFVRVTYDEALEILNSKGFNIPWGEDFGAPHETALGEHFGGPVFIHHFPAHIKAFYFKLDDSNIGLGIDKVDAKYALGADLIAPEGYGEIIGGGQREEKVELLQARMEKEGLPQNDYEWYLDLRRFGSVPHAGFGMGLERVVAWITGVEHVKETTPFPRLLNQLRP